MPAPAAPPAIALVDLHLSLDEARALSFTADVISRLCEGQLSEVDRFLPGAWRGPHVRALLDRAAALIVGTSFPGASLSIASTEAGLDARCLYELHCVLRYTLAMILDPSGQSIRNTVVPPPHLPVSGLTFPEVIPQSGGEPDGATDSIHVRLTARHARAAAVACDARLLLEAYQWADLSRLLFGWRFPEATVLEIAAHLQDADRRIEPNAEPRYGSYARTPHAVLAELSARCAALAGD